MGNFCYLLIFLYLLVQGCSQEMECIVLHKPNGYNATNTLFLPDNPCLSRTVLFDPMFLPVLNKKFKKK